MTSQSWSSHSGRLMSSGCADIISHGSQMWGYLSSLWCSGWFLFYFTMCQYWYIRRGPSWFQKDLDLVVRCVETMARNKVAFLINILRNWFLQLKNGSIIILSRGARGWSLDTIPFSAFYSSIIIINYYYRFVFWDQAQSSVHARQALNPWITSLTLFFF